MGNRFKLIVRWLLIGVLVALLIPVGALLWGAYALPAPAQASSTLARMYAEDQAARQAGFADIPSLLALTVGDWQRLQKARRMVEAQLLSSAADYYHAAMLLQHGSTPDDFRTAQQLAHTAAELGEPRGIKLSALAEDRYLISIGMPQKYGSQFACTPRNGWQLRPVDPAVTDAQRQERQMPPLAEQTAKVARIQALLKGECALSATDMQEIARIMGD